MNQEIEYTIAHLKNGEVILYPTDTVWGIGCDIFDEKAVRSIYKIKQREDSKSLIILVSSIEMLMEYVNVSKEIKKELDKDKPTTIIYTDIKRIPNYLLAKDGSVAIRIVKDAFCKELINQLGKPIISTSANVSGGVTPQIYSEISKTILSDVDYVVNWRQDDKTIVLPSKIIKVIGKDKIQIIRE